MAMSAPSMLCRRSTVGFMTFSLLISLLISSSSGWAQPADEEPERELVPPQALTSLLITYPEEAPTHPHPITIKALLTIDTQGAVSEVEITSPSKHPLFERAVVIGVRQFRFTPARWGEESIAVKVPFEQPFEPPAPVSREMNEATLTATLRGVLKEEGTRALINQARR